MNQKLIKFLSKYWELIILLIIVTTVFFIVKENKSLKQELKDSNIQKEILAEKYELTSSALFSTIDNNITLDSIIEVKDLQIVELKKKYSLLKVEVNSLSSKNDYDFLQALYSPIDTMKYKFDSSQVKRLRIAEIERIECKEILILTSDKLMMVEYDLAVNKNQLKRSTEILSICTEESVKLKTRNNKLESIAKRRGIWGLSATGLLVLIFIL